MELPDTGVTDGLTYDKIREQAPLRWFTAAEIDEIFAKPDSFDLRRRERQQRPTSGAIFIIDYDKQKFRDFRKDGHAWAKKKDGRIQESHKNLKVRGAEKLNCRYAYGETEKNFKRRTYTEINEGHGRIALFHYRELEDEENRKNQSSTQANAPPSGSSFGIGSHEPPITTDLICSNQASSEFLSLPDSQQDAMLTNAEFLGPTPFESFISEDSPLSYDHEFGYQSFRPRDLE